MGHTEVSSNVCVEERLERRECGGGVEVSDGLGEGGYIDMGLGEEVVAEIESGEEYKHCMRIDARFFCV